MIRGLHEWEEPGILARLSVAGIVILADRKDVVVQNRNVQWRYLLVNAAVLERRLTLRVLCDRFGSNFPDVY